MRLRLLGIILLFHFTLAGMAAQTAKSIILYESYEDYLNAQGKETVGDFKLLSNISLLGAKSLIFNRREGDNERPRKVKVNCKKLWGFVYNGLLFRIDSESKIPYFLKSEGSFYYYENGLATLHLLRENAEVDLSQAVPVMDELDRESWGGEACLSKRLNSVFYDISSRRTLEKAVALHPAWKVLLDCVSESQETDPTWQLRKCIAKHNR